MRTLIIEDEHLTAERIRSLILDLKKDCEVLAILESVKAAVEWFRDHEQPDLVFMDIQLADGISFDIFNQVEMDVPVIFITAYQEYAVRAFKVHSVDYLLKPVSGEDLKKALEKYDRYYREGHDFPRIDPRLLGNIMKMAGRSYKSRFMVRVGERIRAVEVKDVIYFYSLEKATYLHTSSHRNYVIDYTLDALEEIVDPERFFRINRQFLTSVEAIKEMIHYSGTRIKVSLAGSEDDRIYVSRKRIPAFREWLDR